MKSYFYNFCVKIIINSINNLGYELNGNPTLRQFIDYFKNEHKLDVGMVSQGVSMLFSFFMPKKKLDERLDLKFSDLVEHVSKKPVEDWQKSLLCEIMVTDEEGEDVDVPFVIVNL